jgi:hypothetical protein
MIDYKEVLWIANSYKGSYSVTAPESQDEMKCGLLLNVVVRQCAAVLKLLSGEDEPLLVRWNTLLILNFSLDVFNGITGLDVEGDGLARKGLDEDLHSASQSQDEMKCGLLLNVVVRQCAAVFKLFSSEDKSLLVGRDTLLVLDLGLDVLNGITGFDIESDGLAGQSFHENLHSAPQSEHEVEGGLLLDIVVTQSATVLKLFSSEDESLLVGWDALLVLNFSFDVLNGVAGLDVKSDGFACKCFHEDLHCVLLFY